MVQMITANGNSQYGIYKFAIDTIDDLAKIPRSAKMGSEAIVTSTSETYIKSGNGDWKIKMTASSGGGGGGSIDASGIPISEINTMLNEIFNEEGENI